MCIEECLPFPEAWERYCKLQVKSVKMFFSTVESVADIFTYTVLRASDNLFPGCLSSHIMFLVS